MTRRRIFSGILWLNAFLVIVKATAIQSGPQGVPLLCPTFCKCDIYEDQNRALCSAQRLISANVEISPLVEVLDLSYNDITYLDNVCLQNYRFLLDLSMSHNAIHTIDLDAFAHLRRLRSLDLSYNRLEYVDERLIEANRKLQVLNLEGNRFMSLAAKPLLRSSSLRSLNLKNSQLSYIDAQLLSALPQLQRLDASQNLLITIDMAPFNALRKLEAINFNENPWACDGKLRKVLELMERHSIEVELDDCDFTETQTGSELPQKEGMLERMELMEPDFDEIKDSNESSKVTSPLWKQPRVDVYDDEDLDEHSINAQSMGKPNNLEACPKGMTPEACGGYQKCYERVVFLLMQKGQSGFAVPEALAFSQSDLLFAFLLGIACGITIACCILTVALCLKICRGKKGGHTIGEEVAPHPPDHIIAVRLQSSASPPLRASLPPDPPLIRSRRSRRRQRPPHIDSTVPLMHASNSRAMVRSHQGSDNFIARLFGRPARHQYYRTLNQNTATLIRRLSRSNLFNNRLSQHFLDRQNSRTSATETNRNGPMDGARGKTPTRAETPPPDYGEVVLVDERANERRNSSNI